MRYGRCSVRQVSLQHAHGKTEGKLYSKIYGIIYGPQMYAIVYSKMYAKFNVQMCSRFAGLTFTP